MVAKNHYDDCPYNCNSAGKILDSSKGGLVDCPYCSKKKKDLLAMGYVESEDDEKLPVGDALGIKNEFLSSKFVYNSIIPDGEKVFLDEESLDWQSKISEELYLGLTIGTLPEQSFCFGISVKGRVERFAYPLLVKAYLGGLSVGKMYSCTEYARMVYKLSDDVDDLYNCDFMIMLINDGCTFNEVSAAKGLMQTRGLRGKPTVFVTTWNIEACSGLLGFQEESSLFLAKPVFVKYKSSNKKHSKYINGLLGVENEVIESTYGDTYSVALDDL